MERRLTLLELNDTHAAVGDTEGRIRLIVNRFGKKPGLETPYIIRLAKGIQFEDVEYLLVTATPIPDQKKLMESSEMQHAIRRSVTELVSIPIKHLVDAESGIRLWYGWDGTKYYVLRK